MPMSPVDRANAHHDDQDPVSVLTRYRNFETDVLGVQVIRTSHSSSAVDLSLAQFPERLRDEAILTPAIHYAIRPLRSVHLPNGSCVGARSILSVHCRLP